MCDTQPSSAIAAPRNRRGLGDYTADFRLALLSLMALVVGAAGACVAWILVRLIGFITNISFYHQLSFAFTFTSHERLGWLAFIPPVVGGLIIGLMAR